MTASLATIAEISISRASEGICIDDWCAHAPLATASVQDEGRKNCRLQTCYTVIGDGKHRHSSSSRATCNTGPKATQAPPNSNRISTPPPPFPSSPPFPPLALLTQSPLPPHFFPATMPFKAGLITVREDIAVGGGKGLYAVVDIPKGTRFWCYQVRATSHYLLHSPALTRPAIGWTRLLHQTPPGISQLSHTHNIRFRVHSFPTRRILKSATISRSGFETPC